MSQRVHSIQRNYPSNILLNGHPLQRGWKALIVVARRALSRGPLHLLHALLRVQEGLLGDRLGLGNVVGHGFCRALPYSS